MSNSVEQDVLVGLVAHQPQVALDRDLGQRPQVCAAEHRPGRVVG